MIHLNRLDEPNILKTKGALWLVAFLAGGKDRPNTSQYRHADILRDLISISHCKCYYCERQLKGIPKEIDHHIEVAYDKGGAFLWNNLYLACSNCNDKFPHTSIPVESVLDPFRNSDDEIEEHITFNKETIRIKKGSATGDQTIKKFRLDSEQLDLLRSKYLVEFYEEYCDIDDTCKKEGGRGITTDEKDRLLRYSYPDHPFSLMFKVILRKRGLL